jgi:hypothetical protein
MSHLWLTKLAKAFRAVGLRQIVSHARPCYSRHVREKDFITKVHKHLPNYIHAWKINDPYHGGVPDAFYSGKHQHCFIEYKYIDKLPKKETSKISINLSEQQRACLQKHLDHNIDAFVVVGSKDLIYTTQDFSLKEITLKEFTTQGISFVQYIDYLRSFCLGGAKL